MGKGKHERKKEHTQEQAQAAPPSATVLDKKEVVAENKAESPTQSAPQTKDKKKPSRKARLAEWLKRDKSFTDWCIAAFTFVLAFAAIYQFIILKGQLNVMRIEQRAWVSLKQTAGTTIALNAAPSTTIAVTNTGKTPALDVVCHIYVEIIQNGSIPHFDSEIVHNIMQVPVVMPGDPQTMAGIRRRYRSGRTDEFENFPLTVDENAALIEGKAWIAVHGIVWYEDVFKIRHWTRFCGHSSVKPGMYPDRVCTAYNAIDEN